MPNFRRLKYYDVHLASTDRIGDAWFESVRDAATWLVENDTSKSINAARVGMSTVLTGKRETYRHMNVTARRYY